jgi:threonyl-tRNA synthetase
MFDQLMAQYKEEIAKKPRNAIKITLPDGKVLDGKAWETTPFDIANGISKGLANATVIAKVNDEVGFIAFHSCLCFVLVVGFGSSARR